MSSRKKSDQGVPCETGCQENLSVKSVCNEVYIFNAFPDYEDNIYLL